MRCAILGEGVAGRQPRRRTGASPCPRLAVRHPTFSRLALAAVLLAAASSLARLATDASLGFISAPGRLPGRREAVGLALASGLLGGAAASEAVPKREVTDQDLLRVREGYDDLVNLMNNWNKLTRKCDKNQDKIVQALRSGQESPDDCIAKPDEVRKYLGIRSTKAKLFNTKQLWVDLEVSGRVPDKDEDRFQELVEDFEKYKRQADEWAYSSAWGEANPGGGRDKVEDYLLRAKKEAAAATAALGEILQILKV